MGFNLLLNVCFSIERFSWSVLLWMLFPKNWKKRKKKKTLKFYQARLETSRMNEWKKQERRSTKQARIQKRNKVHYSGLTYCNELLHEIYRTEISLGTQTWIHSTCSRHILLEQFAVMRIQRLLLHMQGNAKTFQRFHVLAFWFSFPHFAQHRRSNGENKTAFYVRTKA